MLKSSTFTLDGEEALQFLLCGQILLLFDGFVLEEASFEHALGLLVLEAPFFHELVFVLLELSPFLHLLLVELDHACL